MTSFDKAFAKLPPDQRQAAMLDMQAFGRCVVIIREDDEAEHIPLDQVRDALDTVDRTRHS